MRPLERERRKRHFLKTEIIKVKVKMFATGKLRKISK